MVDTRMGAWTRRRFGLAAGAVLAGTGLGPITETAAKRKKRCKRAQKRCGKKCVQGACCPGKPCGPDCDCERTVEGDAACHTAGFVNEPCTSSETCGAGRRCFAARIIGGDLSCIGLCLG
jgi:hypothetical protein